MPKLFDYINSINSKTYIFNEEDSKDYNVFMANKAFSYYPDTILLVNEINKYNVTDKKQHYDFLFHGIDKGKRYSKWFKQEHDEKISLVQEYYKVRYSVAREYAKNLSDSDIEEMKEKLQKGGKHVSSN